MLIGVEHHGQTLQVTNDSQASFNRLEHAFKPVVFPYVATGRLDDKRLRNPMMLQQGPYDMLITGSFNE